MPDIRSRAEDLCRGVPEATRGRAVELAENVLWMEVKLADARAAIGKSSVAIPYDNGGGQPPLLLDGTAGNGHDCLFLARQAPAGSLLLALDIQEAALQASRARLEQAGMAARCCASAAAACALSPLPSGTTDIRLVLHSHAALPELLDALSEADRQRPLLAGIFNFGYLPGTDKRCTTTASGSLAAVDALLERLAPQGCLSLHCYTGHEGGAAEEAALAQRLARLEPRRWRVLHCRDANRETHGESILLAERLPVRQR